MEKNKVAVDFRKTDGLSNRLISLGFSPKTALSLHFGRKNSNKKESVLCAFGEVVQYDVAVFAFKVGRENALADGFVNFTE